MPAEIIDLTTVRLLRDLDSLRAGALHLAAMTKRQREACRRTAAHLEGLRDGLANFADRLKHHHRRCQRSSACLQQATEALESEDMDRMIAARDALVEQLGAVGVHACQRWRNTPQ